MASLLLTAAEMTAFAKLPESLREGWDAQEETVTAYESDEDLRVRVSIAGFEEVPEVKSLLMKIESGADLGEIALDSIPQSVFEEVMFTIGARGVSGIIRALIAQAKTDEDIEGIANLTQIRHALLETNQSVSYV